MDISLKPVGLGSKYLKHIALKDGVPLIVGRNADTFNSDSSPFTPFISRRHASVILRDGSLYFTPKSSLIFVNEEKAGDTFSLLGKDSHFNYCVTMDNTKVEESEPVEKESTLKFDLERILECSVCFEMMAFAHTVTACSCGKSYCFDCVVGLSACPICRTKFIKNNLIHNCAADDFCRVLLNSNPEEKFAWEERTAMAAANKRGEKYVPIEKPKVVVKPVNLFVPNPTPSAVTPVAPLHASASGVNAPLIKTKSSDIECVDLTNTPKPVIQPAKIFGSIAGVLGLSDLEPVAKKQCVEPGVPAVGRILATAEYAQISIPNGCCMCNSVIIGGSIYLKFCSAAKKFLHLKCVKLYNDLNVNAKLTRATLNASKLDVADRHTTVLMIPEKV